MNSRTSIDTLTSIAAGSFVFLTCAFMSVQTVAAQTYDAYATTDSITVGDRFNIVVSVEHNGSGLVIFPHSFIPDSLKQGTGFSLGDFIFLNQSSQGRRRISAGRVLDSLVYEVTTFALDTAYVSLLPVGLISDTDTLVAATPPILLPVTSLVPTDTENIRDITDLAEFPNSLWIWWIAGILILATGVFLYWWKYIRDTGAIELEDAVEPEDPPWEEAQERLRRLEDVDLTDPELIKPFYIELSEILRTYLERRTEVPALETSTSELLGRLREAVDGGLVPAEMVAEIRTVLSQADLVKFARAQPSSIVGTDAILQTRTAIDETEKEMTEFERQGLEEETAADESEVEMAGTAESETDHQAPSYAPQSSINTTSED